MALSVTDQASPLAGRIVVETDATATAKTNVTGTSGNVYMIDVDNSANGAATYLKLWDSAAPVVGTTAADFVFRIPASVRRVISIPEGLAFATAISFACVTSASEAGVTSPTSDVIVRLATS